MPIKFGASPSPTQLAIATIVYDLVQDLYPDKVPEFGAGNGVVQITWNYLLDKIENSWVLSQSVMFHDDHAKITGAESFEYADPNFPQNLIETLITASKR